MAGWQALHAAALTTRFANTHHTSHNRLKDKRDEEDSDGEDEVLPPTEEERAEQEVARREYRDECRKVRQRHTCHRIKKQNVIALQEKGF